MSTKEDYLVWVKSFGLLDFRFLSLYGKNWKWALFRRSVVGNCWEGKAREGCIYLYRGRGETALYLEIWLVERRNTKHQLTKYQTRKRQDPNNWQGTLSLKEGGGALCATGKLELKINLWWRPGATENCHVGLLRGIAQHHRLLHLRQNYLSFWSGDGFYNKIGFIYWSWMNLLCRQISKCSRVARVTVKPILFHKDNDSE